MTVNWKTCNHRFVWTRGLLRRFRICNCCGMIYSTEFSQP